MCGRTTCHLPIFFVRLRVILLCVSQKNVIYLFFAEGPVISRSNISLIAVDPITSKDTPPPELLANISDV